MFCSSLGRSPTRPGEGRSDGRQQLIERQSQEGRLLLEMAEVAGVSLAKAQRHGKSQPISHKLDLREFSLLTVNQNPQTRRD